MHKSIDSFKGVSPTLGKNVYVDGSARIVGDVVLEDDASIWPLVAARGDVNKIRIADRRAAIATIAAAAAIVTMIRIRAKSAVPVIRESSGGRRRRCHHAMGT